jgi:hypothetical protein
MAAIKLLYWPTGAVNQWYEDKTRARASFHTVECINARHNLKAVKHLLVRFATVNLTTENMAERQSK